MGSLMSGWSSSVLSDKKACLMRNRSLTKEEVDAFWRQHGRRPGALENDGEAASAGSPLASPRTQEITAPLAGSGRRLEAVRVRSMPPLPSARGGAVPWSPSSSSYSLPSSFRSEPPSSPSGEGVVVFPETSADSITSWWSRSSWAFLNEPPREREEALLGRSGRAQSYPCDQFHAARIVTGNA